MPQKLIHAALQATWKWLISPPDSLTGLRFTRKMDPCKVLFKVLIKVLHVLHVLLKVLRRLLKAHQKALLKVLIRSSLRSG